MRNRILAAMSLLAVMTLALPAFGNGDGSGWGDMPIDTTTTTTVPPTTTTTVAPSTTTTTAPPTTTTTVPVTTTTPTTSTTSTTSTTTTVPPTTTTTLPPTTTTTTLSTSTGTRATPTTTSTTVAPPPPPELPDPSALAELNCEAGVVVVTLTNDGEAPAVFDVAVVAASGEFAETVAVGPSGVETGTVDLDPVDEDVTVSVSITSGDYLYEESILVDCVENPTRTVTKVITDIVETSSEEPALAMTPERLATLSEPDCTLWDALFNGSAGAALALALCALLGSIAFLAYRKSKKRGKHSADTGEGEQVEEVSAGS